MSEQNPGHRLGRTDEVSTTLLDFAQPMLDLLTRESARPTPVEIEQALGMATTIWNAVSVDGWQEGTAITLQVEHLIEQMPEPLRKAARLLLRDRRDRFVDVPWAFGEVTVVDDGAGEFTVRAEARLTLQ